MAKQTKGGWCLAFVLLALLIFLIVAATISWIRPLFDNPL